MKRLICEGACNPNIRELDEAIRLSRGPHELPVPPYLTEQQRLLRYTPHDEVGAHHWRCTDCGTERRYGN